MLKGMYQAAEGSFSIFIVEKTMHQSKKKLALFVNIEVYSKIPNRKAKSLICMFYSELKEKNPTTDVHKI